jgi:Uma2 family endonuclease
MSAAPRHPSNLGYTGLRMTADEYLALGETQERYELIDGVVVMSPSATGDHNEISAEIIHQLKLFSGQQRCVRILPETDLRISDEKVYRPDISVYRRERLSGRVRYLTEPPDLIVEVLSPATALLDLNRKRDDYARFGVQEYWIVDPESGDIRAWRRAGEAFSEAPVEGDALRSWTFADLVLDLKPLRAIARGEA